MKLVNKMESILESIDLQCFGKSPLDIIVVEYFDYVRKSDDFGDLDKLITTIWSLLNVDSKLYITHKIAKILNLKIKSSDVVVIN